MFDGLNKENLSESKNVRSFTTEETANNVREII